MRKEEKAAISVPESAESFVFSYPVAASTSAFEGGSDAARSFLSVGGYVYLDAQRRITHVTTLLPSRAEGGGLQFKAAAAWRAEWTTALMRQGRFQRYTGQHGIAFCLCLRQGFAYERLYGEGDADRIAALIGFGSGTNLRHQGLHAGQVGLDSKNDVCMTDGELLPPPG